MTHFACEVGQKFEAIPYELKIVPEPVRHTIDVTIMLNILLTAFFGPSCTVYVTDLVFHIRFALFPAWALAWAIN